MTALAPAGNAVVAYNLGMFLNTTWGNEPTPLTRQARSGWLQVPELLGSLQKR